MGPRMEKGTALGMWLQLGPTPVPSGQHHWASPNPHPWNRCHGPLAPLSRFQDTPFQGRGR